MRVILVSSEVVPYSKTGGLADVAGALPKSLARVGCDISVITPRYSGLGRHQGDVIGEGAGELIMTDLQVPFDGAVRTASVWRYFLDGAPIYFIDYAEYFGHGYIYAGGDYDAVRFAFFSRAALELSKRIGGPPQVFHCNDWQTGFIPAYLATVYAHDPFFARTATLFTIHNLAYQGCFDPNLLPRFGFTWDVYQYGMEFHGTASAIKAGLYFSTGLSTVSPRYAQEIQTPEFGNQLDGLLRSRSQDLVGILNGVDYQEWNPEIDPHLAARYSAHDLSGKVECKRDLLNRYQLPVDLDQPLVAVVSRLTAQKGLDLIAHAVWRMVESGAYFVLLGAGAQSFEGYFQYVRDSHPQQVGVYFGYHDPLAHQVEAGADLFLMPSAYEPCGLNQMYSLKYGTVPIVRGVGGLEDTIQDFDRTAGSGNGYKFHDYSAERLMEKFYESLMIYYDRDVWRRLQHNGMHADFSWERAAHSYLDAYHRFAARKG
ncbi:MAG TPA: glycogen/starch synthase [Blastocatellia bacterium]|nr:glycogen/starch synthase [Blastocatellia bacterium]